MQEPQRIGHYEVVRRLGAGSHGVVYYAWDSELLRPVVLKVLKGHPGDARRRTWREARLSSAIEHPNVCAVHGVGEHDGKAYIVMQFVPGRPLSELVDEGPLSLPLGLSIATQVADGLQAAHSLGIIHRDLKPSNVLVTEGGLAKILDFGLAVRRIASRGKTPEESIASSPSGPLGTVGYMAPEQFVGRPSDEKTDLFALGVIVYLMLTGCHPFDTQSGQELVASAIQFRDPAPPKARRDMPEELDRVIRLALAKAPADRIASAGAFADALRSVGKQHQLGTYSGVGQALPALSQPKRRTRPGFVRALAELVHRGPRTGLKRPSVAVLPFIDGRSGDGAIDVGIALADALSGRLSKLPGIDVRPSGSLLSRTTLPSDPLDAGRALGVTHILSGSLAAADAGLVSAWQLVDVESGRIVGGEVTQMSSLDLIELQSRVSEDVFASLRGSGALQAPPDVPAAALSSEQTESYLAARALLYNFLMRTRRRSDLDRAASILRTIVEDAPDFAPGQSALGIAELQYARNGYGDATHVSRARDALERAIAIDPNSLEAKLFRVYTFLALGEKESARHAVLHLLGTASGNYDVHNIAASVLRLDGFLEAALEQLDAALRADPNNAHIVYRHRARIFHYRGDLDAAIEEIDRGLALLPDHPLLRSTRGYLHLRCGEVQRALEVLESVVADEPTLGLAQPTLAIARASSGDLEGARDLLSPALMAAAECDPEMAYRLATFYAVTGEADEALRWLRLAIYLGNENHSWFASNPLWDDLRDDERFQGILSALVAQQARHIAWWRRVL